MSLAAIYQEDNSLAKEFDGIVTKLVPDWRKAKETNMKYKVLLKLFLTILFKMLLNPAFPEGEKVFKLIRDLYIRSSANPEKNMTYLMLICLTLLKQEKKEIVHMNLQLSLLDLYSLKVYNLIIGSFERLSDYFEDLKREILEEVIDAITEKTKLGSDNRLPSKTFLASNVGGIGGSLGPKGIMNQIAQAFMKTSAFNDFAASNQEEEGSDQLEREVFLRILDKFLMILETDFKRIDLNLKIVPIPLVHLNSRIAQEIKEMQSDTKADDKKGYASSVKSFIVETFFSSFFENLPKKDEIWDDVVEDKRNGMNEAVLGLINEVINVMSTVFQKRSAESSFDKWIDVPSAQSAERVPSDSSKKADDINSQRAGSARSGSSQLENDTKKAYQEKIKSIVELVYEGIAVINADGYDMTEKNLVQNIKHSYSDTEDFMILTTGELMSYKQLFIEIYRNRDKYRPFLSEDVTFHDPLRTVLHYLSQDDLETVPMELNDEIETINLTLANKFFETLNPNLDRVIQRKCTTSGVILPTYLLKETDRMYVHELETKGWPCVIRPRVGAGFGKLTIHHNNDIAFMNCTGYCEETSKVKKRC